MIFLTFSCGEVNQKNKEPKVVDCEDQDAICEIVAYDSSGFLVINSIKIKEDWKFKIINKTKNLLFFLIENPDRLLKNDHKYDTIVIDTVKYVYIAIPGHKSSKQLTISESALPGEVYEVKPYSFCPLLMFYRSPKIIIKNGDGWFRSYKALKKKTWLFINQVFSQLNPKVNRLFICSDNLSSKVKS